MSNLFNASTVYHLDVSRVYFCFRKTGGKIDPKIYVFGESEQSDDTTYFLGHVRAIARTTQAAVIAMAEVWQA